MFEYKTRTELDNGIRFYEPDILMFDYEYHNDTRIECVIDYKMPGFGYVIAKLKPDVDRIEDSDDVYLLKIGARNLYRIYHKGTEGITLAKEGYLAVGKEFETDVRRISLSFSSGYMLKLCAVSGNKFNGDLKEKVLAEYTMPNSFEDYKLGVYSAKGNTLLKTFIDSESPSNWVSNVFNGNGGRIDWIKNGFIIEDCEYDCEVESQEVFLKKGKYYFSFSSTNPDLKYYIYPAHRRSVYEKRPLEEILETKVDEEKNILDYEDDHFEVEEDGTFNIKFKGKFGKVTDIAVKKSKYDNFVETDYNESIREASWIMVDLDKIKHIDIDCVINEVAAENNYSLFTLGPKSVRLEDFTILKKRLYNYFFNAEDGTILLDKKKYPLFEKEILENKKLFLFKNVDAVISKFVITYRNGEKVDVLVQKTLKTTVDSTIKTPIIITSSSGIPYDLSSSFREIVNASKKIDLFNRWNPIFLSHTMCLNDAKVKIIGIEDGEKINGGAKTLDGLAENYDLISSNDYEVNYEYNQITIRNEVRSRYKYVAIEYSHCDDIRYEYTNYERAVFKSGEIPFINGEISNNPGSMIVYGIVKGAIFKPDLVFRVPGSGFKNTIDYCASKYELVPASNYKVTNTKRVVFDEGVLDNYDYVVIDYLKNDSYAINEKDGMYEIDISTMKDDFKIMYDYDEKGVGTAYKDAGIDLTNLEWGDFIVLNKGGLIR